MEGITIDGLFTAAGAGAAALVIRQVIEVVKAALPVIDAKVSGATQAFVLSAALYVLAAFALPVADVNGILLAGVSWLTCATAAVGINAAWDHARNGG